MLTEKFSEPTQTDMILEYLKQGNSITPLEALHKFGCLRLGARIYDLKHLGHDIETQLSEVEGGKHIAEYRLIIKRDAETVTEEAANADGLSL